MVDSKDSLEDPDPSPWDAHAGCDCDLQNATFRLLSGFGVWCKMPRLNRCWDGRVGKHPCFEADLEQLRQDCAMGLHCSYRGLQQVATCEVG